MENWVIICTLNHKGVSFRKGVIRKTLGILSDNYRGRLYRLYIVAASSGFNFVWKLGRMFVSAITAVKIHVTKKDWNDEIWMHVSRDQIE